jgi:hypothetical protein
MKSYDANFKLTHYQLDNQFDMGSQMLEYRGLPHDMRMWRNWQTR